MFVVQNYLNMMFFYIYLNASGKLNKLNKNKQMKNNKGTFQRGFVHAM